MPDQGLFEQDWTTDLERESGTFILPEKVLICFREYCTKNGWGYFLYGYHLFLSFSLCQETVNSGGNIIFAEKWSNDSYQK